MAPLVCIYTYKPQIEKHKDVKDMMKKLFVKLSMLIFVLGMSTNVAWGV